MVHVIRTPAVHDDVFLDAVILWNIFDAHVIRKTLKEDRGLFRGISKFLFVLIICNVVGLRIRRNSFYLFAVPVFVRIGFCCVIRRSICFDFRFRCVLVSGLGFRVCVFRIVLAVCVDPLPVSLPILLLRLSVPGIAFGLKQLPADAVSVLCKVYFSTRRIIVAKNDIICICAICVSVLCFYERVVDFDKISVFVFVVDGIVIHDYGNAFVTHQILFAVFASFSNHFIDKNSFCLRFH